MTRKDEVHLLTFVDVYGHVHFKKLQFEDHPTPPYLSTEVSLKFLFLFFQILIWPQSQKWTEEKQVWNDLQRRCTGQYQNTLLRPLYSGPELYYL